MRKLKVCTLCGSLREGSLNRKLLAVATRYIPADRAEVRELDLRRYELPIYNGDIEAGGFPDTVMTLKEIVEESDVLLIASPEYNYSIPGGLKNFIDWLSRGERNSFGGKTAAIFGASTGPYGTVRGQLQLRQCLSCVNVLLLPQPQVMIPLAQNAFNDDGSLKDKKTDGLLQKLVEKTIAAAGLLHEQD